MSTFGWIVTSVIVIIFLVVIGNICGNIDKDQIRTREDQAELPYGCLSELPPHDPRTHV